MRRRREFLGALGGAAAWPLAAFAQQPVARTPRIGTIDDGPLLGQLSSGLRELRYISGQ